MSRIVILEASATAQAVIRNTLKKNVPDLEFDFESKGMKLLVDVYNAAPDAVLIDAECENPKAVPLVRLIKGVAKLRKIPVGLLGTTPNAFDDEMLVSCGADSFLHLDADDFSDGVMSLVQMKGQVLARPAENDIVRASVFSHIFKLTAHLNSLEEVCGDFLNLIVSALSVPAAALYVSTKDGIEPFYVCCQGMTDKDAADFLKVCSVDFEKQFPDSNIVNAVPRRLSLTAPQENLRPEGIPLSAYQCFVFSSDAGVQLGTLHVVKTGAFTTPQLNLLSFAAESFGLVAENAVVLKEKLKFERNIRKAFSRFVPEQIIDELVQGAETEANVGVGEKRDIAILFSDIRSFTNISERNKPETIVAFLNRYFTIMCTIIKKHGGTIDKFIGDAIMALFGAPVSYEDNARRAVAAAYEMREALETVPLEDLVLPEGMKFDIGIGIHYGDVIVGSIGSDDKTDYSVIGDNVNLASRLEGLTKTYGAKILVSEAVKDDIQTEEFVFRPLDDVKVKGKAKAVPIYSVDRSMDEFSETYRDSYRKGFKLYKQGTFSLAKEYFDQALLEAPGDKATKLMISRCEDFIKNPPEHWDGAITFTTK